MHDKDLTIMIDYIENQKLKCRLHNFLLDSSTEEQLQISWSQLQECRKKLKVERNKRPFFDPSKNTRLC